MRILPKLFLGPGHSVWDAATRGATCGGENGEAEDISLPSRGDRGNRCSAHLAGAGTVVAEPLSFGARPGGGGAGSRDGAAQVVRAAADRTEQQNGPPWFGRWQPGYLESADRLRYGKSGVSATVSVINHSASGSAMITGKGALWPNRPCSA